MLGADGVVIVPARGGCQFAVRSLSPARGGGPGPPAPQSQALASLPLIVIRFGGAEARWNFSRGVPSGAVAAVPISLSSGRYAVNDASPISAGKASKPRTATSPCAV